MKLGYWVTAVGVGVLTGILAISVIGLTSNWSPKQVSLNSPNWEYLTFYAAPEGADFTSALDQGWQLTGFTAKDKQLMLYFRRPGK